jgi:hypothetical protein
MADTDKLIMQTTTAHIQEEMHALAHRTGSEFKAINDALAEIKACQDAMIRSNMQRRSDDTTDTEISESSSETDHKSSNSKRSNKHVKRSKSKKKRTDSTAAWYLNPAVIAPIGMFGLGIIRQVMTSSSQVQGQVQQFQGHQVQQVQQFEQALQTLAQNQLAQQEQLRTLSMKLSMLVDRSRETSNSRGQQLPTPLSSAAPI